MPRRTFYTASKFRRWLHSLGLTLALSRPVYIAPAAASSAAQGLPFGVALGLGAVAYRAFGMPPLW